MRKGEAARRGGRWRPLARYALFVAATDLALALALPVIATVFGPRSPSEMAAGYLFLAAAALTLAAMLWPVTAALAAPIWFGARAILRRRGVAERGAAMLAAAPCAFAFAAAPALYLAVIPAEPPAGAAMVAFLIVLAASLAAAPLSAWMVYRHE